MGDTEVATEVFEKEPIFNLKTVDVCLTDSLLQNDEDVDLAHYCKGYKELYNFFLLFGTVFGFVASDIKSKVQILQDFLDKDKQHFHTVKTMLTYEKDNKMFDNSKYVSGSRTLLRLHRGLNFIIQFLEGVYKLDDDLKIGAVCKESYDKCLGPYHTWVIRKTVGVAVYALPTKQDFLKRMAKDGTNPEELMASLPRMLKTASIVYERVEKFYTVYDLHDLK